MARRNLIGAELVVGTTLVSATPCGIASVILTGAAGVDCTIKLYNVAATGDIVDVVKGLAVDEAISAIYIPAKPDGFTVGCVAVVAGTGALGYVSIEPV